MGYATQGQRSVYLKMCKMKISCAFSKEYSGLDCYLMYDCGLDLKHKPALGTSAQTSDKLNVWKGLCCENKRFMQAGDNKETIQALFLANDMLTTQMCHDKCSLSLYNLKTHLNQYFKIYTI